MIDRVMVSAPKWESKVAASAFLPIRHMTRRRRMQMLFYCILRAF
jgi:hypothetical protein